MKLMKHDIGLVKLDDVYHELREMISSALNLRLKNKAVVCISESW